jgi:hypothetical protein
MLDFNYESSAGPHIDQTSQSISFTTSQTGTSRTVPVGDYFIDFSNNLICIKTSVYDGAGFVLDSPVPSYKLVRIVYTNETETEIVTRLLDNENPQKVKKLKNAAPVVYISMEGTHNDPFSFGGMNSSETSVKCVVITSSNYALDGILSIFADAANDTFFLFSPEDHPLGFLGTLKNQEYKYLVDAEAAANGAYSTIKDVTTSKFTPSTRELSSGFFVGFCEFDVSTQRMTP